MKTQLIAIGAAVLAACVHPSPTKPLPAISVPATLIRSVCEQAHPQGDERWDGHSELIWNADGSAVVALECSFTALLGGLRTVSTRVYLNEQRAKGLRDFLDSRAAQ